MDKNKKKLFTKTLKNIFKAITLPIRMLFVYIKEFVQQSRFSIRLSLSFMYLKIIIRTLILTGLLTLFAYGVYKVNIIYDSYNLIVQQISLANKIEYPVLKNLTNDKYSINLYNESKELLLSTNKSPELENSPHHNMFYFNIIDRKYYAILDKKLIHSNTAYFLNIYTDVTVDIKDILNLLKIILLVNLGGIILAFVLSVFTGKNVFQPINELTEAAKNISDENMNIRLNVSGSKSELKGLTRTFNEMMDRIEDGYNRQKQFVSDASHELRTPIAVLQGYIDMLNRWGKNDKEILQESIDAIKNETENMKDLVENLLFLARNDRGSSALQKETFSLSALLDETIRETVIIDKRHNLSSNIEKGLKICADKNRIKQAIRIFLDNAMKYTPRDGMISVNLVSDGRNASIEIIDTGIGMTEEEMKLVFDRFYRSDKSRKREKSGHGLGLSIAKVIILSHEGKITIKSKPSFGTNIRISLPTS